MVVIPARTPTSTSTGTTSTNKLKKTKVYLDYPCYVCGNVLSSARSVVNHVRRIHGFDIPSRDVGRKRPQDNTYEYIKDKNAEVDEMHFACCSCWYHCPEDDEKDNNAGIRSLNEHVREEHDPVKVDITKEGDDTFSQESGRSSRRTSVDESSRSRRDSESKRSTTPNGSPITEESAKEISTKLDELTELFRAFFKKF